MNPALVYSSACPYCRFAVTVIQLLPLWGNLRYVPVESDSGREMVIGHHGHYVHAPHLFEDGRVSYGVKPVLRRLVGMAMSDCDDGDGEKSLLERIRDCIGNDESGVDDA